MGAPEGVSSAEPYSTLRFCLQWMRKKTAYYMSGILSYIRPASNPLLKNLMHHNLTNFARDVYHVA